MSRRMSFVAAVVFLTSFLPAQTSSPSQGSTFQVTTDRAWLDTGMDVQTGETLRITGSVIAGEGNSGSKMCDPKGVTAANVDTAGLPLPSAPPGALIARVGEQGSPTLIGESAELHAHEAGHLFLGMNVAGKAPCQGGLTVEVHRGSEGASAQQTRGQQLKSQLSTAAQIFMSGQFGINKPGADSGSANAVSPNSSASGATTAVSALKISQEPLDSQLRKNIDSLPRRVNDQFQNQGDMVNFVIVGSQKDVQAALDAANWHVADTSNEGAVMNAVLQTYNSKDYLAMPMSTLYLFGRKQDFGYEMAEPIAMVASRHHFRLWKAPFTWKGSEVWVGAGTHDIGFAKDKRNNSVTHKIDPAVDGERDNIGSSLQKTNKTKTLSYYLPPNPVQDAKNATGDGYHSDGKLLVIFLQ